MVNKNNYFRFRVKDICPICKSKLELHWYEYVNESDSTWFPICCVNEDCDNNNGYGNELEYREINHRTIKLVR